MTEENKQKHCTQCGSPILKGDKFCGNCGAKIFNGEQTEKMEDADLIVEETDDEITNRQNDNQVEYENINNTKEQSSFDYYKQVLEKYSDFSGRSTRAEYWYFMLYNIIIAILIAILGVIIGDEQGVLYVLYLFIVFIPQLAVSVRRLHDIGKSGWMFLVSLIPLIGFLWMLILFTTDSDSGTNKYGPNPKNG